jgi:hypothetical protein
MISLTPCFRQKCEVWLHFFAKNAQNDLKTHSCKDSAKFNSAFSATTLSHASRFQRKWRVIKNFEYLGEFEEYFRKCWLYCILYLLWLKDAKNFKNKIWKSCACVPLSSLSIYYSIKILAAVFKMLVDRHVISRDHMQTLSWGHPLHRLKFFKILSTRFVQMMKALQ